MACLDRLVVSGTIYVETRQRLGHFVKARLKHTIEYTKHGRWKTINLDGLGCFNSDVGWSVPPGFTVKDIVYAMRVAGHPLDIWGVAHFKKSADACQAAMLGQFDMKRFIIGSFTPLSVLHSIQSVITAHARSALYFWTELDHERLETVWPKTTPLFW